MLTKSQQLMVADGAPIGLFLNQAERAKGWADNPPKPMGAFLDPVTEAQKALREQLKCEAAALRITKLLAGQARKAMRVQPADIRGKRWDPRRNSWVPINPTESHKMNFDTEKPDTEQATLVEGSSSSVADSEDTMAKKPVKKSSAKLAKKAAKKSVAKSGAKKAAKAKSDKPKGPGVIATVVETIGRANGASADEIMEVLTKRFPDREPEGMRKTVMIQANKNAKKKERSEKRGVVYFGKK